MKDHRDESILRNAFAAEPSTNAERRALGQVRSRLASRDFANPRPWRVRRLALSTLVVVITAGLTVTAIVALRPSHAQPSKSPAALPSATAVPSQPAPATPTVAAPVVACAPTIAQLQMTSAVAGWAVCEDATGLSRIVTTDDGGGTFHDVSPQPLRAGTFQGGVTIAAATDASHAWVMLPSSDPRGGAAPDGGLYRTSDGGRSWSHLGGFPWGGQIAFTGPRTGFMFVWAGGAAGSAAVQIWRTADGGGTWDMVSKTPTQSTDDATVGVPLACEKNGAGWRDDSTGWVTGTCAGSPPVFLVTHDGGVRWTNQSLPLAPGADPGGGGFTTNPPVFSTPRDGTMIANGQSASEPTAFVYTTHDGGVHWAFTQAPAGAAHVVVTAGTEVAVTSDGSLFRSTDGGGRWVSVARHPELIATALASVQFVDPDHGFFVVGSGSQTTLYATTDGGRTLERRQG